MHIENFVEVAGAKNSFSFIEKKNHPKEHRFHFYFVSRLMPSQCSTSTIHIHIHIVIHVTRITFKSIRFASSAFSLISFIFHFIFIVAGSLSRKLNCTLPATRPCVQSTHTDERENE